MRPTSFSEWERVHMAGNAGKLKITQVRSAVGRSVKQKRTLEALGYELDG